MCGDVVSGNSRYVSYGLFSPELVRTSADMYRFCLDAYLVFFPSTLLAACRQLYGSFEILII